ncbi:MAG TPA: hypothetical protein VK573_04985, partial [Gemmatimonadales bacterium]|nr:hypothetical protein [Gemmatimonadales bacterium]
MQQGCFKLAAALHCGPLSAPSWRTVIGVSKYAAVQFTDSLKVPATIIVTSSIKDVAILRIDPKYVADITPVQLGYAIANNAPAVE